VTKKEKWELQQDIASKNERKILRILSMGRMKFSELRDASKLSDPGLLMVLDRLIEGGNVDRKEEGKNVFYMTEHGTNVKEILYLGDEIERLRQDACKYYIDYSDNDQSKATGYGPPFGIWSHLFLDKDIGKIYNPFTKQDIFELEKAVFDKIKENISDNPIKINRKIKNKDKKIVLGFEIYYDRLLKALEEYKGNKEEKMVNARRRELMK
jgi:DNA-binding HxlR family transcriptional regulator